MKVGYYIGRFQPFHEGHLEIVKGAFKNGIEKLHIIIGSAEQYATVKNPFSFNERVDIIKDFLIVKNDIEIHRLDDHPSDDIWFRNLENLIKEICNEVDDEIYFVHSSRKDDKESEKLNTEICKRLHHIPMWIENKIDTNATFIRKTLFDDSLMFIQYRKIYHAWIWDSEKAKYNSNFIIANNDYKIIKKIKENKEKYPYPINDVATDVIVWKGSLKHLFENQILLIRRAKGCYGEGKLALPGGFLESELSLEENAVKELYEETGMKLNVDDVEYSSLVDNPNRSFRGRIISFVYEHKVEDDFDFSNLKAGDDAGEIVIMSLNEILKNKGLFFEDHWTIITERFGV